MGRVLAIDYGTRRVGVAVTDPLKIIASPLTTVAESETISFLTEYLNKEEVDVIVVGYPKALNMQPTHATEPVINFVAKLKRAFPGKSIETINEQFTSKMAKDIMITGGASKKYRRRKQNLDKISASLILQSYLDKKEV